MNRCLVVGLLLLFARTGSAEGIPPPAGNLPSNNALTGSSGQWVNIRVFGAKGDSISDDSAAINAAINSIPSSGGTVYIPNGYYRLSSSIFLRKSYISIVGNGHGSILWADNNVIAIQIAPDVNVQGIQLKDFNIVGKGGAIGGIKLGTSSNYCAFTTVEHMEISSFNALNGYGISLESVQELNIINTNLYRNYNHIYHPVTGYVTSTTVQGNKGYIGWATNKGIVLEGSVASFIVDGIVIESNDKGAISSMGALSNITIENCHLEANGNKGGGETIFISSNSSSAPSKIRLLNNFFYGNVNPILKVDNVIDSHVANNWGLFDAKNTVATTPNSFLDFSMNRNRPADDVIRMHIAKLPGHISARETDRATGNITEYGSRIFTTNGGYLALNGTHLRSTQTVLPTVTVHANSGAGAKGSVSSATDFKGQLTLTTGTADWAVGEQVRVNFNTSYALNPIVLLVPQNANASLAQQERKVNVASHPGYFSIVFDDAETLSKTYRWNYLIVE